ncbi:hypothetical protein K438DRAFT_1928941 [Mycena galopus ATCC 62051]|nr:hypothetical protein K438DRAFT_1928941 [Mycena galopus ATCC 62051]
MPAESDSIQFAGDAIRKANANAEIIPAPDQERIRECMIALGCDPEDVQDITLEKISCCRDELGLSIALLFQTTTIDTSIQFALDAISNVNADSEIISESDQEKICRNAMAENVEVARLETLADIGCWDGLPLPTAPTSQTMTFDISFQFALEAISKVNANSELISASDQEEICQAYKRIALGCDPEVAQCLTLIKIRLYQNGLRFPTASAFQAMTIDISIQFALEAISKVNADSEIISASDQEEICGSYKRRDTSRFGTMIAQDLEAAQLATLDHIIFLRDTYNLNQAAQEHFRQVENAVKLAKSRHSINDDEQSLRGVESKVDWPGSQI